MTEKLRSWTMVVLTAVFVFLYAITLLGIISTEGNHVDEALLLRLEPIVFAIIGYFFGRDPSVQTENRLHSDVRDERRRRVDAEESEKRNLVRAERARRTIEAAQAALGAGEPQVSAKGLPAALAQPSSSDHAQRGAVAAAAILAAGLDA
jgi:hypothetical protein